MSSENPGKTNFDGTLHGGEHAAGHIERAEKHAVSQEIGLERLVIAMKELQDNISKLEKGHEKSTVEGRQLRLQLDDVRKKIDDLLATDPNATATSITEYEADNMPGGKPIKKEDMKPNVEPQDGTLEGAARTELTKKITEVQARDLEKLGEVKVNLVARLQELDKLMEEWEKNDIDPEIIRSQQPEIDAILYQLQNVSQRITNTLSFDADKRRGEVIAQKTLQRKTIQ